MLIQSETSVLTLANAATLITGIVKEVAGTEVADTLNGSVVSNATMNDMIFSEVHKRFSDYTNKIQKV